MIDKKRVLDEFFELVSIRCSTLDEREIADLLTLSRTSRELSRMYPPSC